jgi:hypothetical protein
MRTGETEEREPIDFLILLGRGFSDDAHKKNPEFHSGIAIA